MELPKIKKSEHGMLEGIKSKLGFADANPHYDDGYYDEGFDDYSEEYGEYGPDYNEDDFPADDAPGSRYEPYAPVTSRPARASHARSSARSSSVGSAKLVSIDDVRAHTQVPESLNRDPLPPRRVTSPSSGSYRGDRTMVEAAQPAPANTPIARAAAAANRERSESLNSLFTSTSDDAPSVSGPSGSGVGANGNHRFGRYRGNRHATTAAFDPFDAYAGAGAVKQPSRSVTVLAGQLRRGRAHREGSQGGGCGGARAA
ncbi:MAG: cell division protein SepF [Eggerthella lenta]